MAHPEKIKAVEELTASFEGAGSVFVADYAGLKVSDMTDLRKQLRDAGVEFRVAKNTLLRRAATEAGMPDLVPHLNGPTAIAFGAEDPIPAAKILHDFATRLEIPKVRTFIMDNKSYDAGELKGLASLPSRDILLSQVIAAVESPITGFVCTLDAIIREFVSTVDAIAKQKGEAG
jgi:large subunit ribosomal protein L10